MNGIRPDLPEKYYLHHFEEFLSYLQTTCLHLLGPDDLEYIAQFNQLSEEAQCVLVRIYNRQSSFVRIDSLVYPEILAPAEALDELRGSGFIGPIAPDDVATLMLQLNKKELQDVAVRLHAYHLSTASVDMAALPAKSALKGLWLAATQRLLTERSRHVAVCWASNTYVQQSHPIRLGYLLYLYFGRIGARLNQLSLRDMGIMRTRQLAHRSQARFDHRDEAWSSFEFRRLRSALMSAADEDLLPVIAQAPDNAAGDLAQEAKDQFYLQAGLRVLQSSEDDHNEALALQLLQRSNAAQATEKELRLRYSKGEVDAVKEALEHIIDAPENEALLVFATDFYARKYHRKRTSVLTDMLRESGPAIALDEAYIDSVERGVQAHYTGLGHTAYVTENRLWRGLFGLAFWPELFANPKAGLATEFDRVPQVLYTNQFYARLGDEIEARLASFNDVASLRHWLLKVSTAHYGEANGIFRWHRKLLEVLNVLLERTTLAQIKAALRAMAQDYQQLKDGFPDLMVIENDALRFEEIKAPGDSLRRNQLVTLQMLDRAGFEVRVQSVEWAFNPAQSYVVIDVETTGGSSSGHRVTEVGMVKVRNGEIIDRWQSLINPQRSIPRHITALTGISNDMVADAPIFADVSERIKMFLEGAIFVAHNVNFDYGFMRREFERLDVAFRCPKLCTVRLARKHLPGQPSYSLGKLCQALQIPLAQHHRALHDAEAAAQILLRVQQLRMQAV